MILNWMLPDLDGLEILRRMQAANLDVSTILVPALPFLGDRGGAADYLFTSIIRPLRLLQVQEPSPYRLLYCSKNFRSCSLAPAFISNIKAR
jgi:hypothetical protein